uniref:SFRICE011303.2 n=1 Tax=Spodoptera frugiperda TaxID=7108 RepID=A0A2H1WKH4_SPOFR
MSQIKLLNYLMLLENLFGIYRSYTTQKKFKQYLIMFQIFLQTLCYSIFIGIKAYILLELNNFKRINLAYGFVTVTGHLSLVLFSLTAIYHSQAFKSYTESVNTVLGYFKHDKKLRKSLQITFFTCFSSIIIYVVFIAYRTSMLMKYISGHNVYVLNIILIIQSIIKISLMLEEVMLFFVIIIMVFPSKCLNFLMTVLQKNLDISISLDQRYDVNCEQIQEWVVLYQELLNGYQQFVDHTKSYSVRKSNPLPVIWQPSVIQPPCQPGNSMNTETKLIKDFLRLTKKSPLEIKLMSKTSTGIHLVPVLLMFIVNYAIVVLQFNHVI